MAPEGYIERLFPQVTPFVVDIEAVETISKLHQQFPEEDRRAVAEHLSRSHREDARAIAEKIRKLTDG
jgi:predicted FMN-binding regulatory protein PaiB